MCESGGGEGRFNLQPVQNPKCQLQAARSSQMLTYILFKTQSMLFSATSSKGQLDADLHPVQSQEHPPVNNKQEEPASW